MAISLSLLLVDASQVMAAESARPDRILIESDLKEQAARSFSEKFSIVTDDIPELSKTNLQIIENGFKTRNDFESFLFQAKKDLAEFQSKLVLTHSTSLKSFIAILKSGHILSLDELIRRGIASPKKKQSSATDDQTDGYIGEQDVVYLALRSNEKIEQSRFGDITFVFDQDKILPKAYFSPYAYAVGLGLYGQLPRQPQKSAREILEDYNLKAIIDYRPFIFSGVDLSTFLTYSLAQERWVKTTLWPLFKSKFAPYLAEFQKSYGINPGPLKKQLSQKTSELLRSLGQNSNSVTLSQPDQINLFDYLTDGNLQHGPLYSILNAYRGFPVMAGYRSPVFTSAYDFIEVKVPVEVPLTDVRAIIFPKQVWDDRRSSSGTMEQFQRPIDFQKIDEAINKYAADLNRNIQRSDRGSYWEYLFVH